jgi:hypothetical protein
MAEGGEIRADIPSGRQRPDEDVLAKRARRVQSSILFAWLLIGFGGLALAIGMFAVEARTRFDRLFTAPLAGSER